MSDMNRPTAYQQQAMTVPCFTCGAKAGEWCVTTLAVVPENAARVHIKRVISAEYAGNE